VRLEAVIEQSPIIATAIEDNGLEAIPLPLLSSSIVSKLCDYMEHKFDAGRNGELPTEIKKPLQSARLLACGASQWDADFMNVDQDIVDGLLLAARSLDIDGLLELACAKTAALIKSKSVAEIRKQFLFSTTQEDAKIMDAALAWPRSVRSMRRRLKRWRAN